MKPDNILVDYDVVNGEAVNFEMAIGDWGTSGHQVEHFGGTPMYASSQAFDASVMKDLFAIGRIAMELYLDESSNCKRTLLKLIISFSLAITDFLSY